MLTRVAAKSPVDMNLEDFVLGDEVGISRGPEVLAAEQDCQSRTSSLDVEHGFTGQPLQAGPFAAWVTSFRRGAAAW